MQYLRFPIQGVNRVIANYKNPQYEKYHKFKHYGIDIRGVSRVVFSLGYGEILKSEFSENYGGVVVLLYKDVITPNGCIDVVARYLHLAPKAIKFDTDGSNIVLPNTFIGFYSDYGTIDQHLHLELDTDINYPFHSPQVAGDKVLFAGNDTTLNPMDVLIDTEKRWLDYDNTYNPKLTTPLQEAKTLSEVTANNPALYDFIDELHKKTGSILGKNK